jgi:hypothetical protein
VQSYEVIQMADDDELPIAAQAAAHALTVAEPGATTDDGWQLVARLGPPSRCRSQLLALSPPDGKAVLLLGTTPDGGAHAVSWDAVRQEEDNAQASLKAWQAFRRAAEHADPARRAESNRWLAYFDELQARNEARRSIVAHGTATLHLLDGQPVRAEGASLLGALPGDSDQVTEAIRLDGTYGGTLSPTPPELPWNQQVWARPVAGLWRRGRLRVEPDELLFIDEASALTSEHSDHHSPDIPEERSLERDLLDSAMIKRKSRSSEIYARLLYLALENANWRHADGSQYQGGQRSTADLVATVVGGSCYLDWAWSSPSGVIDEDVVADLRGLGWERLG